MRIRVALGTAFFCAAPCLAQGVAGPVAREAVATPLAFSVTRPQLADEESKTAHYALVGGGLGAIAGLLVDTVRNFAAGQAPVCMTNPLSQPCTTDQARMNPPFGTGILIGGGLGLIVGALVGHQMSPDSHLQVVSAGTRDIGIMAHASW